MRKNKSLSLRRLIVWSMMCALSIILGKYLAFNVGQLFRFSAENLPIIFTGIAFGPLAGALVGVVADLIGCLLVGYEINVLVTLGAAAVGFASGIVYYVGSPLPRPISVGASVFVSHLIGSVVIKTVGLSVYYGMPFLTTLGWRALNYLAVGAVEAILLIALLSTKPIVAQINKLKRG